MDAPPLHYILLFGMLFTFLGVAIYAATQQHTDTYVGVLEKVKVDGRTVTIVLDTDVVSISLRGTETLQTPFQVGHKYQVDVEDGIAGAVLLSVTELSP